MSDAQKVFAARMLAAQAAYRVAVASYRRESSDANRRALEAAQKELDDIQRIAVAEMAVVTAKH